MRLRRTALATVLAAAALAPVPGLSADVPAASAATATASSASDITWKRVYRNDFTDLRDVNAFQSSKQVNDALRPSDSTTNPLQKPSVKSNVTVISDSGARDGKALAVHTRKASYQDSKGTKHGWTNGRMMIRNQNHTLPIRISTRIRLTPSIKTKSAVMWWPASGGWPWEVDFVETFGGKTLTDYWGSRKNISQRWHADLNGDGKAKEQLIRDIKVDATKWRVYDLYITPSRMWIEIDGVERYHTTDKRFIPTGAGFFSIGKAMSGRRDSLDRTDDAVIVDYVEFYKPDLTAAKSTGDAPTATRRGDGQPRLAQPTFSADWFRTARS